MAGRFSDAVAPDLGGFFATVLVFGGAFLIWNATAHLSGAPPPTAAPLLAEVDGGAETEEGKTETTSADAGVRATASAEPKMAPAASKKTYNVILISVDTLRADLGFAGYPRPVSPNIDALAEKSVVFERTYAMASFTPKCLGPLMIGRYSSEIHRDYEHYTKFSPDNVFLAERIHDAGGRSAAAMCHRYFGWKKGLDQGFDIWDTSSIPPNSPDNDPRPTSEKLTETAISLLSSSRAADIPTKGGKPFVTSEKSDGHFFVWIHYLDPHLPYTPHEGAPNFAAMGGAGIPSLRAAYDGEVWYTDKHLGKLLAHIESQPWANETAIIFTADHGEAFGEHSHMGHGRELWEVLVHVPFMIHVPGVSPARVHARRSHVDLVPTVLDLMGIPNEDPGLHGKSLLKDVAAPAKAEDRDTYIDMPDGPYNELRRSVITGPGAGLKLIELQNGGSLLYDLDADPKESKNIASDTARLKEAKEAMARVRASLKEIPPIR